MALASAALVSAETILSLTPIAIKKTAVDPISAMWSRLLTSTVLGYGFSGEHTLPSKEWPEAAALGYTNLLHVASSYESFRHLPAGQAMSLLYTYPFWNLVLVGFFNDEKIVASDYGIMAIAAFGSVLLNMDPGNAAPVAIGRKIQPVWGIFMGLLMALTESGMHTILKGLKWMDAAKSVWVVNSSASVWLGIALLIQNVFFGGTHESSGSLWDNTLLTVFHGVTMFSGYWLRYFAVPRLSTVTYSILSYAGLLASYLFGYLFLKEQPGWMTLLGTLIIVGAGLALQLPK
jgi:drug/metabolite transporter (DMT)-like permease